MIWSSLSHQDPIVFIIHPDSRADEKQGSKAQLKNVKINNYAQPQYNNTLLDLT
jgi:hypothetical protein